MVPEKILHCKKVSKGFPDIRFIHWHSKIMVLSRRKKTYNFCKGSFPSKNHLKNTKSQFRQLKDYSDVILQNNSLNCGRSYDVT